MTPAERIEWDLLLAKLTPSQLATVRTVVMKLASVNEKLKAGKP